MAIHITAEEEFLVGKPTVVESAAPDVTYVAIFEDDKDTGYFYALDVSCRDNPIQDGLHIYNVANVTDRDQPSVVKIGWSVDSRKVVLLINSYPHAVFDFQSKRGFCRSGFPPPAQDGAWSAFGHEWNNSAMELFS